MTVTMGIEIDFRRAGSLGNMTEHLTAPFAAGAVSSVPPLDATGKVDVTSTTREPVLLVAPRAPLDRNALVVEATVPSGGGTATVTLTFAPYTEAEAFVPVYVPGVDANGRAAAFSITLKANEVAPNGTKSSVPAADLRKRLSLQLVEGILGRTLFLLGAEKARIRRMGREIAAMRMLGRARDDALDRHGRELAVPRFADRLDYDKVKNEVFSRRAREPDADYRRRLGLYRRLFLRSFGEVERMLNGSGAVADPNAGAIGELANKMPAASRALYQNRFRVIERNNDFAVAIHIVAAGKPEYRTNFFEFVRRVHLIWPKTSGDQIHKDRFLPNGKGMRREEEERLRLGMRSLFSFGSFEAGVEPAVAPLLAGALIRAARCVKALGGPSPWPLFRAQRADAGSRYELGLGVAAKRLLANELNSLASAHAQLKNADPEFNQIPDPDPADPRAKAETKALLKGMMPASSATDPDGLWLLEPCGLRTVHRVPRETAPWDITYLSHFPTHGLTITEKNPVPFVELGGWTELATGRFNGGSGQTAVAAYERDRGAGRVWTVGSQTTLVGQTEQTTWGQSWTHVVGARLSTGQSDELLFYDRKSGKLAIYETTVAGLAATPVASEANIGTKWTDVVPLGSTGQIIFYDRESGDVAAYEVGYLGANQAILNKIKVTSGWRKGWTQLTPVESASGDADLFFYDRLTGEGALYELQKNGNLILRKSISGLRTTWTDIVHGWFGGSFRGEGLLFYDQAAGEVEVYDSDLQVVNRQSNLPKTWSKLVPGEYVAGELTELFVYERVTGRGEIWLVDQSGELSLYKSSNTFPKSKAYEIEARYHAPGDPGQNVVLAHGLASALGRWTAGGGTAWSVLTDAQVATEWQKAAALPANHPALAVFRQAGLPGMADPVPLVTALAKTPPPVAPELLDTILLPQALSQSILAGNQQAINDLKGILGLLKDERLTSAFAFATTSNDVLLVVAVVPLPVAGTNLYEAPSTAFRWYVVPLEGQPGVIRATGARTEYAPAEEGLCALVAVAYARRGLTDPYEFRVELPDGALLSLEQYEWLMNLLDHAHPAGVRVNTYSIRRSHVDLKGDGNVYALDPNISRTYRAFQRPRQRGETSVTLKDE
jgi:hypothetical protein